VKSLAVILARGGSKRLPRKNILEIHGKPMLAWTVDAAIKSGRFDRVLVSTDDEEIASVGRFYGAEVPFFREQAHDDMATSSEATLAALAQAEAYWGDGFDMVTQLMANCPLRNADDIKGAVDTFMSHGLESQISCFRFGWMNPWWAAKLDAGGVPEYLFPEARASRSQDLPPLYCPSGAIWIARTEVLKAENTFYVPSHTFYPLEWMSAIDVDDMDDFEMAQACFQLRARSEKGAL
jgi:CMP-N-acetylneuraminic acid synthetase